MFFYKKFSKNICYLKLFLCFINYFLNCLVHTRIYVGKIKTVTRTVFSLEQTDYSAFSSLTSLASSTGCSFSSFLPNANGTGAPLTAATMSRM